MSRTRKDKSRTIPRAGENNFYPPPLNFVEWLDGGIGRAAYFSTVDPLLCAPLISKIKTGRIPISFEYACRIERAQKPSKTPLRAIDLMTFAQDRDLYRYIMGEEKPPVPERVEKRGRPKLQPNAAVGA